MPLSLLQEYLTWVKGSQGTKATVSTEKEGLLYISAYLGPVFSLFLVVLVVNQSSGYKT